MHRGARGLDTSFSLGNDDSEKDSSGKAAYCNNGIVRDFDHSNGLMREWWYVHSSSVDFRYECYSNTDH